MQPRGSLHRKFTGFAESVYLTEGSMPIQAMNKCRGLGGRSMKRLMGGIVFRVLYLKPRRELQH